MNDNFFDTAYEENLQETFSSHINTYLANIKRNCSSLQDHFICLVYNFIHFLSEKTKKRESCEDEKAQKKYAKNLEAREEKAKELGRAIHPLIYTSRRISRLSAQFIRAVQNHFFLKVPLRLIIPIFVERLKRYL